MNTLSLLMGKRKFLILVLPFSAVMLCQVTLGWPSEPAQESLVVEVVVTATREAEEPAPTLAAARTVGYTPPHVLG